MVKLLLPPPQGHRTPILRRYQEGTPGSRDIVSHRKHMQACDSAPQLARPLPTSLMAAPQLTSLQPQGIHSFSPMHQLIFTCCFFAQNIFPLFFTWLLQAHPKVSRPGNWPWPFSSKGSLGTSLVIQWLRICSAMWGIQVGSLDGN